MASNEQAFTAALVVLLLLSGQQHGQASRLSLVASVTGGSPALKKPSASAAPPSPAGLTAAGGSPAPVEPPAAAAVLAGTAGVHEEDIYRWQEEEKFIGPLLAPIGRHVGRHIARHVVPKAKHIAREIPKYVAAHCLNVAFTRCFKQSFQCFKDSLSSCS